MLPHGAIYWGPGEACTNEGGGAYQNGGKGGWGLEEVDIFRGIQVPVLDDRPGVAPNHPGRGAGEVGGGGSQGPQIPFSPPPPN